MPNENSLQGYRCPKCGAYGPFSALTICRGLWTDDGLEETTEPEIDESSHIDCQSCGYTGGHDEFLTEHQLLGHVYNIQLLVKPEAGDAILDLLSNLRDDNPETLVEWRVARAETVVDTPTEDLVGITDLKIAARDWELNSFQQQGLGMDTPTELENGG